MEVGMMGIGILQHMVLRDIFIQSLVIFHAFSDISSPECESAMLSQMKQEGMLLICNCSGCFPAALPAGPSG